MAVLQRAMESARRQDLRVVLPEIANPRMRSAASIMLRDGIATPVEICKPETRHINAIRSARRVSEVIARRMARRPLILAAAMVTAGDADAMVAGIENPTKRVVEAAMLGVGLAEGIQTPSSFFIMQLRDGREVIFADCALNVAPSPKELAHIAFASMNSAEALFGKARVAMLSYSTLNSGTGESVDLVTEAVRIAAAPDLPIFGPLQADAALNPAIASEKGVDFGGANTFIFPSLDAGNIGYKLVQELGGAQAIGPILQGYRKPVCDLSRGASVRDIVSATAITMFLARRSLQNDR